MNRMPRVLLGGIVACAMAVVVPPARAHADQWDYVAQLDNHGVSYSSITDVIDLGKSVCHQLRSGEPVQSSFNDVVQQGYTATESFIIVAAATDMCPDVSAVVKDWARTNGLTVTG